MKVARKLWGRSRGSRGGGMVEVVVKVNLACDNCVTQTNKVTVERSRRGIWASKLTALVPAVAAARRTR